MRKLPAVVLVAALFLTSCATTSQIYAGSKKENVYFTIPNNWREIPTASLRAEEAKNPDNAEKSSLVKWQIAYTPSSEIRPGDIFNLTTPDAPIVLARVRSLSTIEVNSISYNQMRDVVVPFTSWYNGAVKDDHNLYVIDDYERIEEGARGVRTIFSFEYKGVRSYMDQTVLLTPDHSKL